MVFNQRGQAAIFVALMFNVLFVFFAMAINIALVVHDKINLQNSVDLATYYAASKQAELLDVIAHENYQIRQSWKLLVWRYRVLGTMGLYQEARNPVWTGELSDTPYSQAVRPSVCMIYKPTWDEVPPREDLCNRPNLRIPPLPEVKVIAGFLGINHGIAALSRQLRMQFNNECDNFAAYNWWFAASIMHAFRLDQRNRKQIIYALAESMSGGNDGDFLDLDGNSVAEGARQTFIKNLTFANRQAFESGRGEFQIMNSLQGVDTKQWLVEIKTVPTMLYHDVNDDPNQGCNAIVTPISSLPRRPAAKTTLRKPYPAGLDAESLFVWATDNFLADSDFQFSIGVEKNPWFMPYVGVKVKTSPRQIFFPIGGGVEMAARAFAKPFGGRIGPWYQSKWERGAPNSDGTLVDGLMAPRMAGGGLLNSQDDNRRLPNYSRYPGDPLGLSSKLAINALNGLSSLKAELTSYINIKEDMGAGKPNDVLAWPRSGQQSELRNLEIAAISPDLFDITYYSVEPNFTKNYWERLRANKSKFNIPFDTPVRPDLGHHGSDVEVYSIQEQMKLAKSKSYQRSEAFYFVRDKTHLLTGWLSGQGAYNYDVSASMENFGKCALADDGLKFNNPGSCVAGGGRTGYSVKMMSRDALFSNQHKIGGQAAPNAILNPPDPAQGW
jgi:hypothetical protein